MDFGVAESLEANEYGGVAAEVDYTMPADEVISPNIPITPIHLGLYGSVIGVRSFHPNHNGGLEIRAYEAVIDSEEGLDVAPYFLRVEFLDTEGDTTFRDIYYFDGGDGNIVIHKYSNPLSGRFGRDLNTEKLERSRPQVAGLLRKIDPSSKLYQNKAVGLFIEESDGNYLEPDGHENFGIEAAVVGARYPFQVSDKQRVEVRVYETTAESNLVRNMEPFFIRVELIDTEEVEIVKRIEDTEEVEKVTRPVTYRDVFHFDGGDGAFISHGFFNTHPEAVRKRGRDYNTGKFHQFRPLFLSLVNAPSLSKRLSENPAIREIKSDEHETRILQIP